MLRRHPDRGQCGYDFHGQPAMCSIQLRWTMLVRDPRTGRLCYGDQPTIADICLVAQVANNGRFVPVYPDLFNDTWWTSRPEFGQFIEIAQTGVPVSYEAPPTATAGEVLATNVIPEAMQLVLVDDVDPAEAVAEVHQKIVAIHERLG